MAVNEEKQLTKEEQDAADAQLLETRRQEMESQRFMRNNPDFPRGVRGAEVLRHFFIEKFGHKAGEWTSDNLQIIWNSLDKDLLDMEDDNRPEAAQEIIPEPVVEAPPQTTYPWGTSLTVENDGPSRVAKMSGAEMRNFLKHKDFGREFARQIDNLRLTRDQLKHNGEVSQ